PQGRRLQGTTKRFLNGSWCCKLSTKQRALFVAVPAQAVARIDFLFRNAEIGGSVRPVPLCRLCRITACSAGTTLSVRGKNGQAGADVRFRRIFAATERIWLPMAVHISCGSRDVSS